MPRKRTTPMKYMLDLLLIAGLVGIGYLWNNQRQAVIAQNDQAKVLQDVVGQLEADLARAKQDTIQTEDELAVALDKLDQAADQLREKNDELADQAAEIDELQATAATLKARVNELQGYRDRARQATMVEPAAAPAAAGQ